MKKRSFFSQLILRFQADTPTFFKKISNRGKALTAFFTALLAIPNIPEILVKIAGYGITGSAVLIILPLLVVKNGDPIVYHDPTLTKEEAVQQANVPVTEVEEVK